MRGRDEQQAVVFSYIDIEQRVAKDHPLRPIRDMADGALRELDLHFAALYAKVGRDSIAPERLLRALLLMVLYSISSEHQLMEQLNYNILYRWFVGLNLDEQVWHVTVFTKNRKRLMQGEVSARLLEAVVGQARSRGLLSEEHFTVDGTLIQAWASRKSFQPKDDPPKPGQGSGHKGQVMLRDTHESKTDAQARLYKKSLAATAVPSYLGHVVTENRNGLVVAACATQSSTGAERDAALEMLKQLRRSRKEMTVGADTQYQDAWFVQQLREQGVIPHVAEYGPGRNHWKNSLSEEERNSAGFSTSQKKRKLVERVFGWSKQDRVLRHIKLRGLGKVDWLVRLVAAAHNLRRMQTLLYAQ